jgi:outer membrane protein assembly factor BamB
MLEPTRAPRFATLLATALLAACGGAESDTSADDAAPVAAAESITVSDVGFSTPESVLHDVDADVYLVSNINGGPLDRDGNGFISRLSPDGEVLDLKWIDGESEGVELSAPKGMAIQGGSLYVTDIDCVRVFDARSGEPTGSVCVDGATFLNDLVAHPETGVIVTDMGRDAAFEPTGTDAVYHLTADAYAPIVADEGLGGPNGVAMRGDELVVVSYFSGEVYSVSADGAELWFPALEGAQLDGVEALDDGRLLVSDWGSNCVVVIDEAGLGPCVVENVEAPADIGLDRERNRVLIPLFMANEVWIRPAG